MPLLQDWAIHLAAATHQKNGNIGFNDPELKLAGRYGTVDLFSFRLSSLYTLAPKNTWLLSYEQFQNRGTGKIPTTPANPRRTNGDYPFLSQHHEAT